MAANFRDPALWATIGQTLNQMAWAPVSQSADPSAPMLAYQQKQQEAQQKNATLEWLKANDPEAFQYAQAGAPVTDALKFAMERKQQANTPRPKKIITGPDNTLYSLDETDPQGTLTPLIKGKPDPLKGLPAGVQEYQWAVQNGQFTGTYPEWLSAKERKNGMRVYGPNGELLMEQGNLGPMSSQEEKNNANRLAAAQDVAATGTALKQTAQMLKSANQNTGYSGPGAGLIGGIFDTAEQFGINAPGTPEARATMNKGGIEAALADVQKTKGAISNVEMTMFMSAAPGMANTPRGNAALIEIMEKIADRQVQRASEMEKWLRNNQTLSGFEESWNKYTVANPIIVKNADGTVSLAGPSTDTQSNAPASGEVQDWSTYSPSK